MTKYGTIYPFEILGKLKIKIKTWPAVTLRHSCACESCTPYCTRGVRSTFALILRFQTKNILIIQCCIKCRSTSNPSNAGAGSLGTLNCLKKENRTQTCSFHQLLLYSNSIVPNQSPTFQLMVKNLKDILAALKSMITWILLVIHVLFAITQPAFRVQV